METDHLLLYKDLHRAPSPVEMDANLEYLEDQVVSTTATAATATAAKIAAEAARDDAAQHEADAEQSKLDAATSASQALAAKTVVVPAAALVEDLVNQAVASAATASAAAATADTAADTIVPLVDTATAAAATAGSAATTATGAAATATTQASAASASAGTAATSETNAVAAKVAAEAARDQAMSAVVIGGAARVSGLKATMVTNTLTATVGRVVAMNASGGIVAGAPGSLNCDVTVAGPAVGGRDQAGAFSADSWVHFFYIYNGTTWGLLASASATAPTLPSGYTHKAYLGTIRKEATNMRNMRIYGSAAHFTTPNSILVNGTQTTVTDIAAALQAVVPAQASRYSMHCYFYLTSDGSGVISGQAYLFESASGASIMVGRLGMTGVGASQQQDVTPQVYTMVNHQALWYQLAVANGSAQKLTLEVDHYIIPNGDN